MKQPKQDNFGYEEEVYSKGLSREDTIERQVRICTFNYSKGLWDEFEYSVHMLIALLPSELRKKIKILPIDSTTRQKIGEFYEQFINIQETLELDTNMIFKKKFIKTYR